ncbi:MAG TPA: NPCBM/NEW2 domain-containing protein [Gemmataceae bacterium]|nr:NPCBM/NEW2 domain-containing protein [Gemmataceae bacterium]
MCHLRTRIALAALLVVGAPAPAAELSTLDGKKFTGEITAIAGNELTFKVGMKEEKFLVTAINAVVVGANPTPPRTGLKHTTVELTDGSFFRCQSVVFRGGTAELKLLGADNRTINVPVRPALFAVNREAGSLKLEQDFRTEVSRRGTFDRWIRKKEGKTEDGKPIEALDGVPGTFGDGDADGGTIGFTLEGEGQGTPLRMTQVAGMIFARRPLGKDEAPPPPAVCKVLDLDGNEYVAAAVARTDKGYGVTTVTGVKVELAEKAVSKFDFAAGSVKYLSDLDPVGLDLSGTEPHKYQRDGNLDRRMIELVLDPATGKTETFPKGLTLHAKTMITYELKGQYKSFRAMAGVDADKLNEAPSAVKLTIDDGTQVLYKGTIKKGEKPVDLNLSVQGVDRLKITVESDAPGLDLGNQVSLGNARVLK